MDSLLFFLRHDEARRRAAAACMTAPEGCKVVISDPPGTIEQNDLIHPLCRQIKRHMEAHGAVKRPEDWWRYYLVAKFAGQEIVPDPDGSGGFTVMNKINGTSSMTKGKKSEFIDWLYAHGAEIGVEWDL